MRLTVAQLRRVIREEVVRVTEAPRRPAAVDPVAAAEAGRRDMEYFVQDSSVRAGFVGPDFPSLEQLKSGLNMNELIRYLGRRPTPEDLAVLEDVWSKLRVKYGPGSKPSKRPVLDPDDMM